MLKAKKLLILGAGGHCVSVLDSLLSSLDYDSIGIVDKEDGFKKNAIMGIPYVGTDKDLLKLYSIGYTDAFIAVGSVGDVTLRKKLYQEIKNIGFNIPNIVDKTTTMGNRVILGEGVFIGKNSVINASSTIGNCVIINTSSIIEHECEIEDFVHVSSGAILCGNVYIENGSHIGAGSIIKQGVHVGTNTMIGMGSVVLKNIGSNKTAFGNPCKEV